MTNLMAGLPPTHPGEVLAEDILPALNISKVEFARRLKISRQQLYGILSGEQPVTPATALKLGRLLGNSATMWLRMQQNHDLTIAAKSMADELAAMEPIAA